MSHSWCRRWSTIGGLACAAAGVGVPARIPLFAQQTVATDRLDAVRTDETLARLVTVDLDHVSLTVAVKAIAKSAGVRVQYRSDALDAVAAPVTVHADRQALGMVLDRALSGTRLRVVVLDRDLVEISSAEQGRPVAGGDIRGAITDAKTKRPLRDVSVILDDSVKLARTDDAGRFMFANVAVGSHRLTIRHIGFAQRTRLVTVTDNAAVTVDVALESTVNTLDQVVVTATGAQRYRELGHVVAQINADSLVREAPITTLSELLTARVPGLQVLGANGGSVGGDVALRLRGSTTTTLDPQPIVIVDGVRYKNTNFMEGTLSNDVRPFNAEPRSPLNDLNVNDIENIEVVKGPSASTLYGPDAANGVIIITTKRGKTGKPDWHVYAYPDLNDLGFASKSRLDGHKSYEGWGHVPDTNDLYLGNCYAADQLAGYCVLDSIVVAQNPAQSSQYSVLAKRRPQWHSGASVSGGSSAMTYFFSGNFDSQTGSLRLSPAAATVLQQRLGAGVLTDAMRNPNTQQTLSLHTNVSSRISNSANVTLSANLTQATQRAMDIGVFQSQYYNSGNLPGVGPSSPYYGEIQTVISGANAFLQTTEDHVQRLTATLGGTVQPKAWLSVNASVGVDLDNSTDRGVHQAGLNELNDPGQANDYRRDNTGRTASLGATATSRMGVLSLRTTLGVQYEYSNLDGMDAVGNNLAPGSGSISTASSQTITQRWAEKIELGGYGEEVFGFNDRLFLTGSLRLDGSTSFGDAYQPRPYPKLGASWILSDEPMFRAIHNYGISELRLRSSFGAASRYPTSEMKVGRIAVGHVPIEGQTPALFVRQELVNPLLRPEHTREAEYGADATVSIVRLSLTWFNRRTIDQLGEVTNPYGLLPGWYNLGTTSGRGFEATANIQLVQSNHVALDAALSYADNTTKLISYGNTNPYNTSYGSVRVGYPLNAIFGASTIDVADTVGGHADGIILSNEIVSSAETYRGVLVPPKTFAVTPTLSLFGGRLRASSLFDRQMGGVQMDVFDRYCKYNGTCLAAFLNNQSPLEQAKAWGYNAGDWIVPSDFTRWRELNITADLPLSVKRRVHLSRGSVSFQVRNLRLWTRFPGPDPESVPSLGTLGAGSSNTATGAPFPRAWSVRFDLSP